MTNTEQFSTNTQAYIKGVEEYLTDKFGTIKENWKGLIQMLAVNYEIFLQAKSYIDENGMLQPSKYGMVPSPMIKVMNDASIQVQKLVNSLTISPLSENKLKDKMVDSDEEDAIKTLLG